MVLPHVNAVHVQTAAAGNSVFMLSNANSLGFYILEWSTKCGIKWYKHIGLVTYTYLNLFKCSQSLTASVSLNIFPFIVRKGRGTSKSNLSKLEKNAEQTDSEKVSKQCANIRTDSREIDGGTLPFPIAIESNNNSSDVVPWNRNFLFDCASML